MKKIFFLAMAFMLSPLFREVFGQGPSLEMKYTEPSQYPYITTGFRLKDALGNEIRNSPILKPIKKTDIIVEEMEFGKKVRREVLADPDCPAQTLTTFSAVLVVDISQSMGDPLPGGTTKIDAAKEVLKEWARQFDPKRTETAITAFCGDAVASQDNGDEPIRTFTSDKDELLYAINRMPFQCTGTNYNAAFLYKRYDTFIKHYSALYWCRPDKAKYKPVIVFLTDGNHLSDFGGPINGGRFNIDEVQRLSALYNVTIYVIQFGTEPITPENQTHLQNLSFIGKPSLDVSPNIWMGVNSAQELKDIYNQILIECGTIGDPPPCYISWKGGCDGGSATFTFPNHGGLVGVSNYVLPPTKLPNLSITPRNLDIIDVANPSEASKTITLKAEKNFVEITGFQVLNDNGLGSEFTVTDWGPKGPPPFVIDKDSTYKIVVRYRPTDSLCSSGSVEFTGSACTGREMNVRCFLTPFVENIHVGNANINGTLDTTFTSVFCNKTCQVIQIPGKPRIIGTNASNFTVLEPTGPSTLNPGDCLQMKFRFSPTEPAGTKTAKIEITTDYNTNQKFLGDLTGNAVGGKTMIHQDPGFDSTNCNTPSVENIITLENAGVETITITNCEIVPNGDSNFEIKGGTYPSTIVGGGNGPITIVFHPTTPPKQNTDYTATLRVTSDAKNSPYDIPLVGPMRNIDFNLSGAVDFQQVCVGTPKMMPVTITNTGNVMLNVTASVTGPYTTEFTSYQVPIGGNSTVNVTCDPLTDGAFNTNLTITNAECTMTKTVALTAMGVYPNITLSQQDITMSATIGNSDEKDLVLTNKSKSTLRLLSITPCEALRFVITDINPNPPTNIAPDGTVSFKLKYTPQTGDVGELISCIKFLGETCNFDTNVAITGAPGAAKVDIAIDTHKGYRGDPIDIPVYLRNGENFDNSNTTQVTADVRFDGSLLIAQPQFNAVDDGPPFKKVTISNNNVQKTNSQQTIATLKFNIATTGATTSTPLEIKNATGNGGAVFISKNGLFNIDSAAAKVIIDSVSSLVGNDIKIKVMLDAKSPLPGDNTDKISMTVSFDGTILEPTNKAPILKDRKFSNGKWTVDYELPIAAPKGNVLAELTFHTMIGASDTTTLFIESLTARGGSLTAEHGFFKALGICQDGENDTKRFFIAKPGPGILAMNPNPTDGMINIEYQTLEKGLTKMWVSDMLGNHVSELFNGIPEPGKAYTNLDGTQLPNGVYFIILQTPTQIVREKFYIMR